MFSFNFSKREIKELVIAWIILSISISFVFLWNGGLNLFDVFSYQMLFSLSVSLPVVGVAFVLHEVGHKLMAQHFGHNAEFRMDTKMLFFALFLAYAGGFLFAAPGAVRIFGRRLSISENGKISLSGPLVNLSFGLLVFLPLSFFGGYLGFIGTYGVLINFFLSTFNLLPFGYFDGKKIFRWNKLIYITSFGFSLFLTIYSYLYVV
ncbi:metalloprotease [archaeon SCG-AAA382B04]|nr:metalloprotease [archaeon SCG-AAA382B04]